MGRITVARMPGPEHGSYWQPCISANWIHSEMQCLCALFSSFTLLSTLSAPTVTWPLPLLSYFPQLPSINSDVRSPQCPEGSAFGQIQLGSVEIAISMKNAIFFAANSWNKYNWIYIRTGFVSELMTHVLVYFWLNIILVNGIHFFFHI